MDTTPTSTKNLEYYYHVDGKHLERHYKEHLSDYPHWNQKEHADKWLLYPENMGTHLSIDETPLSNGELYTILTNKAAGGAKGSIIAIVESTNSKEVMRVLDMPPKSKLDAVQEVTLDMSESMRKIIRHCFPKASQVIDRFHVKRLACSQYLLFKSSEKWTESQKSVLKYSFENTRILNRDIH